jgi:hypothetical protein
MNADPILEELMAYRPGKPVLSVYLGAEAPNASPDSTKLHLKQILREFETRAPEDVRLIREHLEHNPQAAAVGLAAFSCAADGYFRAYPIALPVRSRARLLDRPYVKPLADLIDSYGHTGVVLVDQQGARLFHFHLGELREEGDVEGERVKRTKLGGASAFPGRRGGTAGQTQRVRATTQKNLKDSADQAARFFAARHVRRVLVGGAPETVARFLPSLPKAWQSLVRGTFVMDKESAHDHVLRKAMEVATADEREREGRLVEAVITAAAKGKEGVVRLDDTLSEVHAGRVQTLVLRDGFRAPGYRCLGCGFLTSQSLPTCPFCGKSFERIEDAVELAIHRVLEDGGEVQVVHDSPKLEKAGSIGGLLRY